LSEGWALKSKRVEAFGLWKRVARMRRWPDMGVSRGRSQAQLSALLRRRCGRQEILRF
jgi:hypothetical protein